MRLDRSQHHCVAEQEKIQYSAPSATVETNTMRVGELEPEPLSSDDEVNDEDFELRVVENSPQDSKEAIVNAARMSERPPPNPRFHEPEKRILTRRAEKEEKPPTPKSSRFRN